MFYIKFALVFLYAVIYVDLFELNIFYFFFFYELGLVRTSECVSSVEKYMYVISPSFFCPRDSVYPVMPV